MAYTTLISPENLLNYLGDDNFVIVDCRFNLADPSAGYQAYLSNHIPGAVYANLDNDLSGPPLTDKGRHPLPASQSLLNTFSQFGIDHSKQVVVYDEAVGGIASRLWWLLRYMGHENVALLDGGWRNWKNAQYPSTAGIEQNSPTTFTGQPRKEWLVLKSSVPQAPLLIDARAPERYRGEVEPLDPVAGHISGAVNYCFKNNLDENGRFLPTETLRSQLQAILGDTDPNQAVFYCGSGVTACHNLLALTHAELGNGRLYAGSWSDWIAKD